MNLMLKAASICVLCIFYLKPFFVKAICLWTYLEHFFFVGFVTDGEFNSLRTMGCERPISILQLISDSRSMARSMRVSQIEGFLKLDARGILNFPLVCVIQPQGNQVFVI